MGSFHYLRGRQLILGFTIIFHDGRYDRIAINIGPFNSERFMGKWGRAFIDGIWEAIEGIPEIDECELEEVVVAAHDPANDEIIFPGDNPKEIAWRFLDIMVPLIFSKMS